MHAWLGGSIQIFGAGRKYLRTNRRDQDFTPYAAKGWLTDLSPHGLSVPGSIELARGASFYIGANSCLALVTMSRGIPTVIIEPEAHANPAFWQRLFDLPACLLLQQFGSFDIREIIAFLSRRLIF